MMIAGYFTAVKSLYLSTLAKSWMKVSPYALVNCSAAPNNMAKMKKSAIFLSLNRKKEVSPKASITDLFCFKASCGGHFGKVKAYSPKNKEAAEAT